MGNINDNKLWRQIKCLLKNAGGIEDIIEGENITIDKTDPKKPVISSTGGGGSEGIKVPFDGELDVSKYKTTFYEDYLSGQVLTPELSVLKKTGAIATVRIVGNLLASINPEWNFSGQPITNLGTKLNELTVMYVSPTDVRVVNRVVKFLDITPPSSPTGLSVSEITGNSIRLTWIASSDNIGVVGYKIYQDNVYMKTVTQTTSIITGLSLNTLYLFKVSAIDAANNESEKSNSISVTTSSTFIYDNDYQNLLNYAIENNFDLPNDNQKLIDNQKIVNLKTTGAWNKIDKIHIFNTNYTPSSFAKNFYRLNWKSPSAFMLTADVGKEPIWISGNGFKANGGAGQFLKTGFIPSVNGVNMKITSASEIIATFGIETTYSNISYWYGGRNSSITGQQILLGNSANGRLLARVFKNASQLNLSQLDINAHYHVLTNTTTSKIFRNSIELTDFFQTPIGDPLLPSVQTYILGFNDNNVLVGSSANAGVKYQLTGDAMENLVTELHQILNETYIP